MSLSKTRFTYAQAELRQETMVCIFVISFVFLTIKLLVANKNNKNSNFDLWEWSTILAVFLFCK